LCTDGRIGDHKAQRTMVDDFKFDLGFSFLGEDEPLARSLNDALKDRISTFIYSDAERQVQLAGRDGEELFARVFGRECRTVAVLYRVGWGERGFTSAEATAIRNRAFEFGYDFSTFIPLDKPPTAPVWLPRNRLWVGIDRFGIDVAAGVLDARVQEAGGTPRIETAASVAERAQRQIRLDAERDQFLDSDAGFSAMQEAFWETCRELEIASAASHGLIGKPERGNQGRAIFGVSSQGFRLVFALSIKWGNAATGSTLHVTHWRGPAWGLNDPSMGEPRRRDVFVFDLGPAGQRGWRRKGSVGAAEFMTPGAVAKWAVEQLASEVLVDRERDRRQRS
jgi:hypothetical protein